MRRTIRRAIYFAFTLLINVSAFALSNSGITYHGRIVNPDGTALQGSAVQFQMQIRSPGNESCLLYQEQQTINMTNSNGVFTITINDGTGLRTDAGTYTFDAIFANRGTFTLAAGACASGTTYTPNFADGRVFQVSFRDENMSAYEALPMQTINFAPMSLQAKYIGGFGPTNLLRFDDTAAASNTTVLNTTQLNNLMSLINGTSTQYLQDSTTSGAVMPVVAGTPASPSTGSVWYNSATNSLQYYNGTTAQTLGSGSGSGTVTSVAAGTGLTGGTITTSGTIALATAGTAGTYYKVTTDAYGRVTSGASALVETDIPTLVTAGKVSGSAITSGAIGGTTSVSTSGAITTTGTVTGANVSANNVGTKGLNLFEPTNTNSVSLTAPSTLSANYSFIFPLTKGNANQVLQTDGAGQASWITPSAGTVTSVAAGTGLTGGTITTSGTIALATSGVTASTYKSVTVDTYGRVTAGSNPTTLSGFGITDAVQNAGGTPSVQTGLDAAKPPAATAGRVYVATDTQKIYSDSGSAWTVVGSNSGAGGTVTSVALSAPSIFTVSGSPVTTTGTLGLSLTSETAHQVFAAPQGANGAPTFRNFNISDLMSSVSGGFLTGSSCTSGQALVYSSITDTIACSTLSLSSSQVTTALGFTPVQNGGGTPSVTTGLDASKPTAGTAGRVYVATDTQKIYSDSGSAWTVVGSNAGAGGTISALNGDVSATGSGTVAATVNSVGGSTAANVHSAELAANGATAANTASKIIARDSSGNFAAGTATLNSAVVGQTNGVVFNDTTATPKTVSLTAPTTVTTSYVLKLPPAVALTAGQVLTSDTSGNLSWTTPSTTATSFSGILPVANGGTGTATGSITGTGALTLAAGGSNANVVLTPSGTGSTVLNGNVGIGTASPQKTLEVAGDSRITSLTPTLSFNSPSQGADQKFWDIFDNGANLTFRAVNDGYTGANEWLHVARGTGYTVNAVTFPSGNIGIGNGSPIYPLDVFGIAGVGSRIATTGDGSNNFALQARGSGTDTQRNAIGYNADPTTGMISSIFVQTSGTPAMSINSIGNVGIGTTSPLAGLHALSSNGQFFLGNSNSDAVNQTVQLVLAPSIDWSNASYYNKGPGIGSLVENTSTNATSLTFFTYSGGAQSERLRINSSGNVGIGTANPVQPLNVVSSTSDSIMQVGPSSISSGGANATIYFKGVSGGTPSGGLGSIFADYSNGMHIRPASGKMTTLEIGSGTGALTVDGTGKIGIGTASPASQLDVVGSVKVGADSTTCSSTIIGAIHLNGSTLEYCNGTAWTALAAASGGAYLSSSGGTVAGAVTVSSGGETISAGGLSVNGGINDNSGAITNAGNISGNGSLSLTPANTATSGTSYINSFLATYNPASAPPASTTIWGTSNQVTTGGSSSLANATVVGGFNSIVHNAATTLNNGEGAFNQAYNGSSGTITNAYGSIGRANNASTGTITNAYGSYADVVNGSGTVSNGYGMYTGIIDATNKFSFYAADPTAPNYFAANVGVGTTSPTYKVTVQPTASTDGLGVLRNGNGSVNGTGWGLAILNAVGNDTLTLAQTSSTYTTGGAVGWAGNGNSILYYPASGNFMIGTGSGSTPVATFSTAGNVGIGNSSPNNLLDIGDGSTGAFGSGNSVSISSSTANSTFGVGQSPTARGIFKWIYNTTPANGYLVVSTTTAGNPLILQTVGGNVGVGTNAPAATLDVNGTIKSTATSNSGTTIDFSTGNLQYTSSSCGAMTLNNMQSGATYTLAVQGSAGGTCSFTAWTGNGTGTLQVKTGSVVLTQSANKHTLFTFMVMGSYVYVAAIDGY